MKHTFDLSNLKGTMEAAKVVAIRYRDITGKPLGITGEIGQMLAIHLLDMKPCPPKHVGYDAYSADGRRILIKTRSILPHEGKHGQKIGAIRLNHEWDSVLLVLLDTEYEPVEIREADRKAVEKELSNPGSEARNKRGALGTGKFRRISKQVWSRKEG